MNADGVAIGDRIGELNDRLDNLYSIKRQIANKFAPQFGQMVAKTILLRDTSNFILRNPLNQITTKKQSRLKDTILSFSSHAEPNSIISYIYVKSSFFVMYNNSINENKPYPQFQNSGVVTKDIEISGIAYTSQDFIDLGININTIDDIENGIIIRYIENKDIDESIFNTRMEIYNLTHRGHNIQDLRREIEELKKNCCEKLESKIDKVKINLSRVEGMVREVEPEKPVIMPIVRGPQFSRRFNNNNNKNNKTLPISRAHVSRFINGSTPTSRSKPRPLKTNSPRRLSRRNLQSFSVENL